MLTKEKVNIQTTNVTLVPATEGDLLQLWAIKDKKLAQDLFQVVHKYEHYYLLQNSKGIKMCARFQEIESNSEEDPMLFY